MVNFYFPQDLFIFFGPPFSPFTMSGLWGRLSVVWGWGRVLLIYAQEGHLLQGYSPSGELLGRFLLHFTRLTHSHCWLLSSWTFTEPFQWDIVEYIPGHNYRAFDFKGFCLPGYAKYAPEVIVHFSIYLETFTGFTNSNVLSCIAGRYYERRLLAVWVQVTVCSNF